MHRTASLLVLLASSTAFASPSSGPPAPASFYRFDVSIAGVDASPVTYTLVLGEDRPGILRTGPNIPLAAASGSWSREQLGMDLDLSYMQHGGVLLVEGEFGISALVSPPSAAKPTWGRLEAKNLFVPVTPGKPTQLASLYDVTTHRRYEVTVTAQRVM